MSSMIPPNGVYHIQNVAYPDQMIGLEVRIGGLGFIVAGRHEDSNDPHIEWQVKANERGTISIKSDSRDTSDIYIGFNAGTVGYSSTPYEWELSNRDNGRWAIREPISGMLLYLPSNADRTPVLLAGDGAGDGSYWWFVVVNSTN